MPGPDGRPAWQHYEAQIHEMLSRLDDTDEVLHDERIEGRLSRRSRQVDVWVKGTVAGLGTTIVVECKLRERKLKIGDIDEFVGKVIDLGADKGVIYAAGGFTAAAMARAEGQHQPSIAAIVKEAEFDYDAFLGPDCPNVNCYTGSIGWRDERFDRFPSDPTMFSAGICDTCGTWAVKCGGCGEVNLGFADEIECFGCEASWVIERDRDRIENGIRMLTDSEGRPLESDSDPSD